MRQCLVTLAILAPVALAGCGTGAPTCQFLAPPIMPEAGIIGRLADQSQQPMLPYNPDWVSSDPSLPLIGSPGNPCAGQPGHPGRLS
ncbi:MAG TPA: hypothetical protein VMA53_22615 [Stellaceae bacterium]|nr:hypothetical protein [Stellaceae bacterium]